MSDLAVIYVVVGTTGEYSDRIEWLVAAYDNEAAAQTHATLAKTFGATINRRPGQWVYQNPYDPKFQLDYTGTDYYVAEVPMRSEVPQIEVKA